MARVSEEHRRRQADRILDAAEVCFVRGGFHATSMDEIIAEAGISSSTVYRYFSGKQAIIQEVSRRRIAPVVAALRQVAAQPDVPGPADVVGEVMGLLDPARPLSAATVSLRASDVPGRAGERSVSTALLAVHAWAETARDDDLAATIRGNLAEIHDVTTALVEAWQTQGAIIRAVAAADVATMLQRVVFGEVAEIAVTGRDDKHSSLATILRLLAPATATGTSRASAPMTVETKGR